MNQERRSRVKARRVAIALVALAALCVSADAQDQSQYDRGTPPQHAAGVTAVGSYSSADIGTINLGNGSLNFRLPLGNVGGRGFWLPLTLNYTSKLWSGSRGQVFNPAPSPGHTEPTAYAAYNEGTVDFYSSVAPGWTVGAAPFLKARGVGITPHSGPNGCTNFSWVLVKLTLVLPDKGEIELRDEQFNGAPVQPMADSGGCATRDAASHGKRWHATDGSGIVFINDNDNGVFSGDLRGVIITADGTRYHFVNTGSTTSSSAHVNSIGRCDWVRDRNGNKVVIQYSGGNKVQYIDQLGRLTTVEFNVADPQTPFGPLALLVTLPGYNGQVHYYKVKTATMNQNYRAGINPALPVAVGGDPGNPGTILFALGYEGVTTRIDTTSVVTQLILPDGRPLTFKYNEYGEVAEVQMPAGGKVQYDYASKALNAAQEIGLPAGNSLAAEVLASGAAGGGNVHAVDRAVVARRTYPDGSTLEGAWSYEYKISKSEVKCTSGAITLLDEWHYFLTAQRFLTGSSANGPDGTGYSLWSTGIERRSEVVNGAAVLSAAEQDWAQRKAIQLEEKWTTGHSIQEIANDNRVSESRRYLDDGSFSKVVTSYDSTTDAQNHVNNPVDINEYDFDSTLKRHTTISYLAGGNYTGTGVNTLNILSLPLEQSVKNGSETALSHITYEYDIYTADGDNAVLQTYTDYASIPGRTNSSEPAFDTTYTTRGNATRVTRLVSGASTISSYTRYDVLGNVVSVKDQRGNIATINYLDDFGLGASPGSNTGGHSTYALPTKIESPPPNHGEPKHTASSQYDFSTGLLTGFKDRNGIVTQSIYNDPFDRPTQIKAALGTPVENHTAVYYAGLNPLTVFGVNLANNDVLTAKDQSGIDDGNLRSWTRTDGFGRTIDSFVRDPQGDIRTTTTYDGLGRAKRVTNPYRTTSDPTYGYADTTYDMLGRSTRIETFDGSGVSTGAVTSAYTGNQVTVTDQALKVRRSVTDGLGRLKQVIEDPNGLGYSTTYGYDALDDLTSVTQGVQTRTFVYDGLKRLMQASNPESGAINYTYDPNSNLLTRQDARSITTTYVYDALNRVTSRSYMGDPQSTLAVSYKYDGQALPGAPSFSRGSSIGRLVGTTYGGTSAGNYQGYDELGRVNVSYQQTDSQNYGFGYVYNLASEMTSETYPSGRVITTGFDTAGRLSSVNGQKTGEANKTYASQFSYAAHGAVASMRLGNTKWEHATFNSRLQPTQIGLGTSSTDSSTLMLDYGYGATSASNNGNVLTQKITAPGLTINQCYGYDSLNRLVTAEERSGGTNCAGTQQWKQAFSYDRYGNRNFDVANTTGNVLGPNPTISQTTNRLTPGQNYGYDSAGNLTSDPATSVNGIAYDPENRQTQYTKTGQQTNFYFYDGDGHRVKKIDNSGTTVFVYNAGGQLIAEYTSGAPLGSGTSYLTSDHLGSTRVVMKPDGSVARHDYLPFGEEIQAGTGGRTAGQGYIADSIRQRFTQKERDNESGLDYFLARYYSSAQGRFTSPDEFTGGPLDVFALGSGHEEKQALPYADITAPQSLNKYQYAYNNPLRYVDPNGHDVLGYELLISGSNHVPKQDRREVSDVANLGPKDEANGGYFLLNLRTDFDKGDNVGDYKHVRAAVILNDRTIRNDGQENPSSSHLAVEGQSRFVTDNPGVGVSGQPKAALEGRTALFGFVAGEYNTKTKELSSKVAYYAVKLVFGKNGQLDTKQSAAVRLTRDQFIQLTQQRNVGLPKDKKKQDCPECLLSPPNQPRR